MNAPTIQRCAGGDRPKGSGKAELFDRLRPHLLDDEVGTPYAQIAAELNMSLAAVENGKVVLPPDVNLPSGTKVRVETLDGAITEAPIGAKLQALDGVRVACQQTWRGIMTITCMAKQSARNHERGVR